MVAPPVHLDRTEASVIRLYAWWWFSYVPLTRPHRLYKATVKYVNDVEAMVDEMLVDMGLDPQDRYPQPIPRARSCCEIALRTMLAYLRSTVAWKETGSGQHAAAVFEEHMADLTRAGAR